VLTHPRWLRLLLLFALLGEAQADALAAAQVTPGTLVARFGETPIYSEELSFHIREQVALVANYFTIEHQVNLDGRNWTQSFGGEVPVEVLRGRALDACLRAKVIQLLALEKDLGEVLPFPGFSERCEEINQFRREVVRKGGVVYGPPSFSPAQLYRYKVSNQYNQLLGQDLELDYAVRKDRLEEAIEARSQQMPITPILPALDELVLEHVGASSS
jgi:hypothetical protein